MSAPRNNRRSLDDDSDDEEDSSSNQVPALDSHLESARRFLWDEDEEDTPAAKGPAPVIRAGAAAGDRASFRQDIDLEDNYSYSSNNQGNIWARRPKRNTLGVGDDIRYGDASTRLSDELGKSSVRRRGFHTFLGCCGLCCETICVRYCIIAFFVLVAVITGSYFLKEAANDSGAVPFVPATVEPAPTMAPVAVSEPVVSEPIPEPAVPQKGDPSFEDQVSEADRYTDIKALLKASPFVNSRALEDPSTAQGMALNWLAKTDTFRGSDSVIQRYALAAFFFGTQGRVREDGTVSNTWNNKDDWMTDSSICTWYGVECVENMLVHLSLNENNVNGELPPDLGALTTMESLELRDNKLFGALTADIPKHATNLVFIDLGINQFHGKVPDLSALTSLKAFNAGVNHFTGFSQPDFSTLTDLTALALESNKFNMPMAQIILPESIETLFLEKNEFTGTIPEQLYSLTSLTEVRLDKNQLTGTIGTDIGALSNLVILKLTDNQLEGELPDAFGSMPSLVELFLVKNKFSGTLPPSMTSLASLEKFMLADNQFTGPLPLSLENMVSLVEFYIPYNNFTGTIPDVFDSMEKLELVKMQQNHFEGPIPLSLAFCEQLTEIILDENPLVGSISTKFGNLANLKTFSTQYTSLTGSVPAELCTLVDGGTLEFLATDCKKGEGVTCSCCHRCA